MKQIFSIALLCVFAMSFVTKAWSVEDNGWRSLQDVLDKNYRYADLTGADLTGADLASAVLSIEYLREAELPESKFNRTRVLVAYLSVMCLTKILLLGVDTCVLALLMVDLYKADLTGADLTVADLREVELEGVDLSLADLREAKVDSLLTEYLKSKGFSDFTIYDPNNKK